MSANLDLVRSIYTAWESGDYSSADWAHPEIEWMIADGPTAGCWTGVAGMAEGWGAWLGAWENFRQVADECRELDSERVLVLFRFSGRGKTSGLEIGHKGAGLFHVREGKVTKFVGYWDRELAFADLGLASEADSASS